MRYFSMPPLAGVLVACGLALGEGTDGPVGGFAGSPDVVIDDVISFLITDGPVLSVTPANTTALLWLKN
jgi:hypothetical protein